MSGHEHERLSAYLDDALAADERAQVAAHLDACGECAARLAELAAVDGAVASVPSEAPPGYFEAFPSRVRARLEPRASARRLPVWTWAAAAALLLAVVAPLTLLRQSDDGSRAPAREIPAAAAAPESAKPQARFEAQAPEPARAEPKADTPPRRPVPARVSPVPQKREPGFASAPAEVDAPAAREPAAPTAAAREEEVAALADRAAMAEAVASGARNQAKASGEAAHDAVAQSTPDEARLARGRAAGSAAGAMAAPKLVTAEAEWQRLDAARPRTPAEWRRLREEWRLFVARDPAGPQADEARVRVIEAGREAWRAGSDPADEARFRQDAADYLEREGALQKERVRGLVR
ncbi:MAG TPA: zf-HC2 domain-containing protein [Vicinamibacteria bacterium]|nr:zf-HC2 domain-containing protein [Vicinamibacteria bacterium]